MTDWKSYVERFYSLPPEKQKEEWAKLTPEQRTQFEAARADAPSPPPPPAQPKKSSGGRWLFGCFVVFGVLIIGFLGLAFLGSLVGSPEGAAGRSDSPAVAAEAPEEAEEEIDEEAALADLDALAENPDRRTAALRAARRFLDRFPDSTEAGRVQGLVQELESAAEEAKRQQAAEAEQRKLAGKWSYSSDTDEMTGRTSSTATIRSENTVDFSFPYQGDQRASLIVRNHPSYGRNIIFRIEKGQIICNTFQRCEVRVRFDEGQPRTWKANPPADQSTTVIFLQGYDSFLRQLRAAETIRIQPEIFQQGSPVFEFSVGGYDHARYTGE